MYSPSDKILEKYANVLIKYALGGGTGINPGEVVSISLPECASPFAKHLLKAVIVSGGHPILTMTPDNTSSILYEYGNEDQLKRMPEEYLRAKADMIDHHVGIIAETDKYELEGIDPKKIMQRRKAGKFYMDALDVKEGKGHFTRTVGLYGTKAMAKDVNMTLKSYRQQIIKACFLDKKDPITSRREVSADREHVKQRLNSMEIDYLDIQGEGVDLRVQIGENRARLGGGGRNIPSFELFISPDRRGTNGYINFSMPLYRYGSKIDGISLTFGNGKVIKSSAKQNESLLHEMIATENADKIGEFSLTDSRFSRITKFMGETLYDENIGGQYGNSHIALGKAYKDSYVGDPSSISTEQWNSMGFNDSVIHTDMIHTADRTVTATLRDGTEKVIYKNGQFAYNLRTNSVKNL